MRTALTLIALLVVAAASFWFLQDITQEPLKSQAADADFPDYFLENFSITNMDSSGQAQYRLAAKKMLHYANDERAELTAPVFKIDQINSQLTLSASRAIYKEQENLLTLLDNVVIYRAASTTQSELFIYTDYLKINTQSQIAETHLAARVTTAQAQFDTIGLKLDNKQATFTLLSQVKGRYDAPK